MLRLPHDRQFNPRAARLQRDAWLSMVLFVCCCSRKLPGQMQAAPSMNGNLVFLDPAHGGADPGVHLTDAVAEKEITLALEVKLRAALSAKGFAIISSRDGDAGLTSDQRAEMGNHSRALACILLHATTTGNGPSISASSLAPELNPSVALPWLTAQAAYVAQSLALLEGVGGALRYANLHPVTLRASVPPIDSLACPAVVVELAPIAGTPASDQSYQQRTVDALTLALIAWRAQIAPTLPKTAPRTVSPQPFKPVQPTGIETPPPPGGAS